MGHTARLSMLVLWIWAQHFPNGAVSPPNVCVFNVGSKPESSSSGHRPGEFRGRDLLFKETTGGF